MPEQEHTGNHRHADTFGEYQEPTEGFQSRRHDEQNGGGQSPEKY
jgi:hypothetical protein